MKKVLLIEDNPGDTRLIRGMIPQFEAPQFNLECVERLSAGLEYLAREEVDVVLLDLNLPDSHGLDTFNRVHAFVPDVPIIVLTGLDDEKLVIKGVKGGAHDYLVKGEVSSSLLVRSICYAIERQQLLMDLKQKSEDLHFAKESFYNIVQISEDGMVVIDQQGVVRFANKSAISQFKLDSRRLIGSLFGRPIVSGNITEIDILCADGTKGLAEMRVVNTRWQGKTAHLAMLRDITDRKRAEELLIRQEKLKDYSDKLERMVEERTKELRDAQDQLVRHEKLAILGQLAGGVSHELRNPLGAIRNAIYFLNMAIENPEPEVKESLEIIEKEVTTSNRIITALLDFARPRPPTRQKVNLNGLLKDVLSQIKMPESIKLIYQLNNSLPLILADKVQLDRVFNNIIQNAIQAMPEGGRLLVKSGHLSSGWVAVSITDTGKGVPDEYIDKLFEPLFTSRAKGIGLGLSITKTLVERHDGTIDVMSKEGEGSTFVVKLPVGGERKK